ncbi:putative immunity protein BlpX [Streptococcus pneumoniae]|nr:putative immunity protein BlpX [Streptococcus pneumoniae]
MKYRLFFVIFLSSVLDILLGTFLQISIVSIGWLVLYSGLFFTVVCLKQEFSFLLIKGWR